VTVWLVESNVGGYDYMLYEVFSNEAAAQEFLAWYQEIAPSHYATMRAVEVLDVAPEPPKDHRSYAPVAWGYQR
jgi:hypothetical protein